MLEVQLINGELYYIFQYVHSVLTTILYCRSWGRRTFTWKHVKILSVDRKYQQLYTTFFHPSIHLPLFNTCFSPTFSGGLLEPFPAGPTFSTFSFLENNIFFFLLMSNKGKNAFQFTFYLSIFQNKVFLFNDFLSRYQYFYKSIHVSAHRMWIASPEILPNLKWRFFFRALAKVTLGSRCKQLDAGEGCHVCLQSSTCVSGPFVCLCRSSINSLIA